MTDQPSQRDDAPGDRDLYADLLEWIEGGTRGPAISAAQAASPGLVARKAALVREMLAALEEARLPPLAEGRRRSALALLEELRDKARAPRWRRLVASLVPGPQAPAPAMRAATARESHALFEVEGYDLDLSVSEAGTLLGQILPREDRLASFEGGTALLQGPDGSLSISPIELDGEFSFARVPRGALGLVLTGLDLEIVVRDVELPRP